MNRALLTLILFLITYTAAAQSHTVRVNVYFPSDKHKLQPNQQHMLDTLVDFLEDKEIKRITLTGHTDSDADSVYNMELSQKRMETVRNYLTDRSLAATLFKSGYLGESRPVADNELETGKQKNRRVEITIVYKEREILEEPKVVEKQVAVPIPGTTVAVVSKAPDPCAKDTMIYLPQGARYLISICDYLKYKDCIRVEEYLTPESILSSDFTTVTSRNEQLITGGMFDIKICEGNVQLVHPLIFRVPVPNNGLPDGGCGGEVNFRKMSLWSGDHDGRWEGNKRINLQKSADTLFYEFRITQSGKYNLDYKMDQKNLTNVKVKFKARSKVRLINVRLLYTGPQTLFEQKANKSGRTVKFRLPACPSNGCACIMVEAWGVTRDGDTIMTTSCLNDYKKRLLFGKCKIKARGADGDREYALGFIPVQRSVYRKYIFLKTDWKSVKKSQKTDQGEAETKRKV